ncbi:MAG: radical SAM family heme chaperone HemW [Bacteroidetes bacterium]|nr:radical SAM family heme chaperone HemW [Bacteroidota bacterium]MBS1741177.1 radical SAM family heme chaperone HemW [Bacteroidota bacterium]
MAGIYLHIPFCKQKCNYCNFHFSTSLRGKADLLQAIHKEIDKQQHYLGETPIQTIYFGGGTPSLLSADEINKIFDTIFTHFPQQNLLECTLEANPDDLNLSYLQSLKNTPISRLSIGVQSFHDADLRYMNRAHHAQQADYAIKAAQDKGFSNLTIDLIYGTPGLNNQAWKQNLRTINELQIPHFSAYALTVEPGTQLHHAIHKKQATPVDSEQTAQQFEILVEQASVMGYEHYEISNLAKPGHHAIHNTNYWKGVPYLGIGPSAHSFNGTTRQWNIANNAQYTRSLLQDNTLIFEIEKLTEVEQLNEYIMTSLRTIWGCDAKKVEQKYGSDYAKTLLHKSLNLQEKGWLRQEESTLTLTPNGKLFADKIASELFFDKQ